MIFGLSIRFVMNRMNTEINFEKQIWPAGIEYIKRKRIKNITGLVILDINIPSAQNLIFLMLNWIFVHKNVFNTRFVSKQMNMYSNELKTCTGSMNLQINHYIMDFQKKLSIEKKIESNSFRFDRFSFGVPISIKTWIKPN